MVQSISSRAEEITTEYVKERLLTEAARQGAQKKETALASRTNSKRKSSKGSSDSRDNSKFRGKCHRCDKVGHMKKDCTASIQRTPAGREGEQSLIVSVNVEERTERALGCKLNPSDWFIDSGASAHMTGMRHLFVDLDGEAYERSITADDHRLKSRGVGSVKIDCRVDGTIIATRLQDTLYVPGLASV